MNSTVKDSIDFFRREGYLRLFLRFLRFGMLAWGGPVAQIAMIRQELVEEQKWISRERFNRVLAVYQALPGPEAHELCVYFGMIARGRLGGFLAGLGFMLPGFVLMFALSWFYVSFGIHSSLFDAVFYGFQAAVVALIVRAIHRIGQHALVDRWLWGIAIVAATAEFLKAHFLVSLLIAGTTYVLCQRRRYWATGIVVALFLAAVLFLESRDMTTASLWQPAAQLSGDRPSLLALFASGLSSGLLTFGGAYTVIPFLQHDAVEIGRWMTDAQFLDGLALSGILPAPLIIFSTFVGYLGGGALGAILLTVGIFLPAFSFTLIGHNFFERLIENKALHGFLEGLTAGVVGLIAATAVGLLRSAIPDLPTLGVFVVSLFVLYSWKAKAAVAVVVLTAGLMGLLLFEM